VGEELLAQRRQKLDDLRLQGSSLAAQIDRAEGRARDIGARIAAVEKRAADRRRELVRTFEEAGFKVSPRGAAMVLTMAERVLFDEGSAELREGAGAQIERLAAILKSDERFADRAISVEGHTDSVRPRKTADRFPTNWDLSMARAVAVVRFLAEHGGVPAERVCAAAFAQTRPAAGNRTAEGRAQNRRVEVVIHPRARTARVAAEVGSN